MKQFKDNVKIPTGSQLSNEVSFPVDLSPHWLQKLINEHSESYGTPPELWATAFLSGISAAAGKKFKLITGNYSNYPQLWLMVIGPSGTGKSDAFRVAFMRLSEINEKRYATYKLAREEWKANEEKGERPHWKQVLVNDTTPEALFATLQFADNGLTLYRDELSGWFSDFGRYNKSGEVGHYLSIFDNNSFSVNRKNDDPLLIPKPLLNIFGTIQPSVLENVLNKNNADQSGFAQRFLYLYPDFPPRKYKKINRKPELGRYNEFIDQLTEGTFDGLTELAEDAELAYGEFYDEMEYCKTQSDDFWVSVYSKAQIQVLRLALVVKIARLVDERNTGYTELKDIQAAIGMQKYFIQSLKKFKEQFGDTKLRLRDIIKNIYKLRPDASPTDIGKIFDVSKQYISRIGQETKVDKLTVDNNENPIQEPISEESTVNHEKDTDKREVDSRKDIKPTTAIVYEHSQPSTSQLKLFQDEHQYL